MPISRLQSLSFLNWEKLGFIERHHWKRMPMSHELFLSLPLESYASCGVTLNNKTLGQISASWVKVNFTIVRKNIILGSDLYMLYCIFQ